jgi:hypothetical protein
MAVDKDEMRRVMFLDQVLKEIEEKIEQEMITDEKKMVDWVTMILCMPQEILLIHLMTMDREQLCGLVRCAAILYMQIIMKIKEKGNVSESGNDDA